MKKINSKKDIVFSFKVSKEELEQINAKFKESGYKNFSEYIRDCLTKAEIIKASPEILLKLAQRIDDLQRSIETKGCDPEIFETVRSLSRNLAELFENLNRKYGR